MTTNTLPVLIISGSVGAGKSTIAAAAHDILKDAAVPHAYLDLDSLSYCWPPTDRFNQQLVLKALSFLWPMYKSAGARRLLLARVIETESDIAGIRSVLEMCSIRICHLAASEPTRIQRLQSREVGNALEWHITRTVELENILAQSGLEDFVVHNENYPPDIVARQLLIEAGWLS